MSEVETISDLLSSLKLMSPVTRAPELRAKS